MTGEVEIARQSFFVSLAPLVPPSLRVAKRAMQSWYGGEAEFRLLPVLCDRNRLSVDVGANNGVYSWQMARYSAGVIAFEPQPAHAAFLTRAFGHRIRVEQVALSDDFGETLIRVPRQRFEDGRATIEPENELLGFDVETYSVARRPLDSYELQGVGLVKIDVEGHELAVLRGATGLLQRDRPKLLIEAEERHRDDALSSVCRFLDPFGYRPHCLADGELRAVDPAKHRSAVNNFIFLPAF